MPHTRLLLSSIGLQNQNGNEIVISPLHKYICELRKDELVITPLSKEKEEITIQNVKGFITVLLNKKEGIVYYTKTTLIHRTFDGVENIITESLNDEELILHSTSDAFIVCIIRNNRVDVIGYNSMLRRAMLPSFTNYLTYCSMHNILAVLTTDNKLHLFIPRVPHFVIDIPFLSTQPKSFSFSPDLEQFVFLFEEEMIIFHNVNSSLMMTVKLHEINEFFGIAAMNKNNIRHIKQKGVHQVVISTTTLLCYIKNEEEIKSIAYDVLKEEEEILETTIKKGNYGFIGCGGCGTILVIEEGNIVSYISDGYAINMLRGMISVGFEEMWGNLVTINDSLKDADQMMIGFENQVRGIRLETAKTLMNKMNVEQLEEALKITMNYYQSANEKKMYYRDLANIAEIGLTCIIKLINIKGYEEIMKTMKIQKEFIKSILIEEDMLTPIKTTIKNKIKLFEGLTKGNLAETINQFGFTTEDVKTVGMKFVYQLILKGEIQEAIKLVLRLGFKDIMEVLKELYNTTNIIEIRKRVENVIQTTLENKEYEFINEYDKFFEIPKHNEIYSINLLSKIKNENQFECDISIENMKQFNFSFENSFSEHIVTIPRIINDDGTKISIHSKILNDLNDIDKQFLLMEEGKICSDENKLVYCLMHGKINEIEDIIKSNEILNIDWKNISITNSYNFIINYLLLHPTNDMFEKTKNEGLNNKLTRMIINGNVNYSLRNEMIKYLKDILYLPLFCNIMNSFEIKEFPIEWMKYIKEMKEWKPTNEMKELENIISSSTHTIISNVSISELYKTFINSTYEITNDLLSIPKDKKYSFKLRVEDYLNDKRMLPLFSNNDLNELIKFTYSKDTIKSSIATIVLEIQGNENIRFNVLLKELLTDENDMEMMTIEELDESNKQNDILVFLEQNSEPNNHVSNLRNFLANRWNKELSIRQIELLAEKELIISFLKYIDQHNYKLEEIKKCIESNWPISPIKSHIEQLFNDTKIRNDIGITLSKFTTEGENGICFMNWLFTKEKPISSLLRFIQSSIVNKTLKTIEIENIEETLKHTIYSLIDKEFECKTIQYGFYLFDKENPIYHFINLLNSIAIASSGEIPIFKKMFTKSLTNEWKIGDKEFVIDVIINILNKFIEIYSKSRERIILCIKELISIETLPNEIKKHSQEYLAIFEIIEFYQLNISYTTKAKDIVNILIEKGIYIKAHEFASTYVPNDSFLPISEEINKYKRNTKEIDWKEINSIISKRSCQAIDAGKYFYKEVMNIYEYEDYEHSYIEIATKAIEIIEYCINWLKQDKSTESENLLKDVEKYQHLYEESKTKDIPACFISKPTEKTVYYLVNRGDYSLAIIMNDKIQCNEMKIFKQLFDYITNVESYYIAISQAEEYLDCLIKSTTKIQKGLLLLKNRFLIIHKYYEDKSIILALIHDSTTFRSKRIDIISNICGINTLKKYVSKVTYWIELFNEAKEFIKNERITDNELVPMLCKLYIDISTNLKPICITGFPTTIIKSFLSMLNDPKNIIDMMLTFSEEVANISVLSDCYSCCYIAGEITMSSNIISLTMESIQKRLQDFLTIQNIVYLVRFAVKTKTFPDLLLTIDEKVLSIPKYLLQLVFNDNMEHQNIIPSIDEKSHFENQIYYLSDLKEIQNTPSLSFHSNYEQVLSDSYAILNTSMEGGLFYFEKATKIIQDFITNVNEKVKTPMPIYVWYPQFVEAMKCYSRAIGFFNNSQEYYWANQSVQMIGILSLQIYFDNVQLIGLTPEKAQQQLLYFTSFDDAYLFAKHYNLLEPLKWSKSIYLQCVTNGNIQYLDGWLSIFDLDRQTLTDIIEYHNRNEKSINIKKKDTNSWDNFIDKIRSTNPSLLFTCLGTPITKKLSNDFRSMIMKGNLNFDSLK
ncbi:Doublecortin domain-containing protein [Entamoeba marina]